MAIELKTPEAPATQRQLWLLHILTGQDTRAWELTMKEASDRINELMEAKGKHKTKGKGKDWLKLLEQAQAEAVKAYNEFVEQHYKQPRYVAEQHSDPLNDNSPVVKSYPMTDLCGFVWIELKLKGNEEFIKAFKDQSKLNAKGYGDKHWELGDFSLVYRKSPSVWSYPWQLDTPMIGKGGNGDISAQEHATRRFCELMARQGVELSMRSRLD